jgi:hypothetical protein
MGNGALNDYATVPGGFENIAAGRFSLAAGRQAKALHEGSFVWADNENADFASTSTNQFLVRAERVGIGTASPQAKLDVAGGVVAEDVNAWDYAPGAFAFSGSYTEGSFGNWRNTGRNADCKRVIGAGNRHVGFGVAEGQDIESPVVWMYSQPGNAFEVRSVNYNAQVPSGNTLMSVGSDGVTTVQVLTLTGGSDVAEPFPMASADIPKGSVVVIDDAQPGRLKLSERAYDTRVAGIVSGANGVNAGLTLRQQGVMEGDQNVALSGRVYALADATPAPIQPGDLLTTSDTPGHAMKVTDSARAQGAILGKAMSRLSQGRGMVLVLVSLQ